MNSFKYLREFSQIFTGIQSNIYRNSVKYLQEFSQNFTRTQSTAEKMFAQEFNPKIRNSIKKIKKTLSTAEKDCARRNSIKKTKEFSQTITRTQSTAEKLVHT